MRTCIHTYTVTHTRVNPSTTQYTKYGSMYIITVSLSFCLCVYVYNIRVCEELVSVHNGYACTCTYACRCDNTVTYMYLVVWSTIVPIIVFSSYFQYWNYIFNSIMIMIFIMFCFDIGAYLCFYNERLGVCVHIRVYFIYIKQVRVDISVYRTYNSTYLCFPSGYIVAVVVNVYSFVA